MLCCIGCRWQGFGGGKTAGSGEVSEKRPGVASCWTQPVPMDPLQGTAEPLSHSGGTSGEMYLGKGKNAMQAEEEGKRM